MTFEAYKIEQIEVHVPSTDYYSKNNESSNETIEKLSFISGEHATKGDAINNLIANNYKGKFIILETFELK